MKKYSIETKLFTFILAFTILALAVVPFAGASPVYIAVNNPAQLYTEFHLYNEHPSATAVISAVASDFVVANQGYVTVVTIQMRKYGSPTGEVSAKITDSYSAGGGYMLPNETSTLEISSSTFDIEDLTDQMAAYSFQFNGTTQLLDAEDYSLVIYISDNSYMDASNYLIVGDGIIYPGAGNTGFYQSSQWAAYGGHYPYYTIIGDTEEQDPEATPTPTPTADPSATATPNPQFTQIWDTLSNLINLLIPLLCVVLPAFFGYKFAGAWGFLAGINIGAILAYVILGTAVFPLWGIVVILILDALLLFGKVGFHS